MNMTKYIYESDNPQQHILQWFWETTLTQMYRDAVDHLKLASFAIWNFLIIYLVIGALMYIYSVKNSPPDKTEDVKKRVLFVIAHPDDECMFFGPTILRLIKFSEVYVLCLTVGNYYIDGTVRKKELYNSCRVFGIPQCNIMIKNCSRMPDNPGIIWNAERTARILLDHIESLSIDEVFTFDIGGVSGHLNHISIFYGFAHLCLSGTIPPGVRVFTLVTANKLRKYSLFFDAALSVLPFCDRLFTVTLVDSGIIREAMHQYKSQLVWYRAIYIYISRYMYINTYKELELEDVQLVLQMSEFNLQS